MAKKAQAASEGKPKRALYAGTFDPFHNGHHDIVKRALQVFDQVTVLVAVSPSKTPLLPTEERLEALREAFKGDERVKVEHWSGLVVDYARENGIGTIIRGLRPTGDFDNEFQMASMNRELEHKVDTVFFMTGKDHFFLSSALVREIFQHGGPIHNLAHPAFLKRLEKLKKKGGRK